jgi:DNA topoisomerase-3
MSSLSSLSKSIYNIISKKFISIFYPPAVYQKVSLTLKCDIEEKYLETFNASFKVLLEEGYLKILNTDKKEEENSDESKEDIKLDLNTIEILKKLKKNDKLSFENIYIKEGETTPPKRYNSGSIILAMENAGQLIEDDELRAQIKGSGIGTSATRAEILKKLVNNDYISLNKKTQILSPTILGEMIYDVVFCSIRQLLNPELTASWEKGLNYVANGTITTEEYMQKLDDFVSKRVLNVKNLNNQYEISNCFRENSKEYKK